MNREEPTRQLADVLRWEGTAHRDRGDIAEAERLYQQSAEVAHQANYSLGVAHALNCRGCAAQMRGRFDEAEDCYREAGERARAADDMRLSAMAESNLGTIASMKGDIDAAIDAFSRTLLIAEELRDVSIQSLALNNIGLAHAQARKHTLALPRYARALGLARESGDQMLESACLVNRAETLAALSRLDEATLDCNLAILIADRRGDRIRRAEALKVLARIARTRQAFASAERLLTEALEAMDGFEEPILTADLHREMAEVQGNPDALTVSRITAEIRPTA